MSDKRTPILLYYVFKYLAECKNKKEFCRLFVRYLATARLDFSYESLVDSEFKVLLKRLGVEEKEFRSWYGVK